MQPHAVVAHIGTRLVVRYDCDFIFIKLLTITFVLSITLPVVSDVVDDISQSAPSFLQGFP